MTTQSLAYKTYEIPCNVEHYAKPINLSGARTIKLTSLPSGVQCWISTENTGENKFPLINRGDGWVDLPNPLYDIYVFTKGTTLNNENIILNYTGQGDFFEYGMSSGEKIEKIGSVESVATQAVADISNAILGSGNKTKIIKTINIMGDFTFSNTYNAQGLKLYHFPLGRDTKISDLKLENDKYYRIRTIGHFDIGQKDLNNVAGVVYSYKTADKITRNYKLSFAWDGKGDYTWCQGGLYIKYINDSVNIRIYDFVLEKNIINETISFKNIISKSAKTKPLKNIEDYSKDGYFWKDQTYTFEITPIWDVTSTESSSVTSAYFDITQSAHLSLIKEIATPSYINIGSDISSSFNSLVYSNIENFFSEYNLWGYKTRHSNYKSIITNYEGTGVNANSFDLVVSGNIINSYDKLVLGWNVSNIYNESELITLSAANCHSSLIMEISEV